MKKTVSLLVLALAAGLALSGCKGDRAAVSSSTTTASGLLKANFEHTVAGKPNHLYVLTNSHGMEVSIINYGGRIASIMVPDRNGKMQDVVLGCDSLSGYTAGTNNFGALIGRYGNRIYHGSLTIDGHHYQLKTNNYGHCLHGGPGGYSDQMWDGKLVDNHTLVLSLDDPDGFNGFPGRVKAQVTYTLGDDNSLTIHYTATTTKPTVINLTNHSYFNLSGDPSVDMLDEQLYVDADSITPIDSTFMTDGSMMAVAGTPFDFRKPAAIGTRINQDNVQLKNGLGIDHNFVLNTRGDISKVAASLYSPKTGILMQVFTTEPGVQVYCGNFLNGSVVGKHGVRYPKRASVSLETQHYPNSPNEPAYPSTVVRPGKTYDTTTIFRFSIRK